jgi:signal transduction histidine kinase
MRRVPASQFITFLVIALFYFYYVFIKYDFVNYIYYSVATDFHPYWNELLIAKKWFVFLRLGGVWFAFMGGLVYLLIYLFNRKNQQAFWLMIFLFSVSLCYLGFFVPMNDSSALSYAILFVIGTAGMAMCAIAGLRVVLLSAQEIPNKRHRVLSATILTITVIRLFVYFTDLSNILKNTLYVCYATVFSLMIVECLRFVGLAYHKKQINIFSVISIYFMGFCSTVYLLPYVFVNYFLLLFLNIVMPFSLVVVVAYLFAKSFTELQKQEEEIKRLSLEKQMILEKQTELLTQQVNEKTAELKILNETKDRLFSIISHDLRTPIYSIIGTLDLIEQKAINQEESDYLIKNLREEVSKTYEVLDNLLNWSLSQMKQFHTNQTDFELINAVSPSVELFRELIRKKNINLILDIPNDTTVYADENHIRCIVRNLLSNAIKFTPNQGKISVSAINRQDFVEFEIKDSGIGIMPNQLLNIFQFPTINRATNGQVGTGLGLNLCKELIEQNGGSISVTSIYQKGTSFVVKLLVKG